MNNRQLITILVALGLVAAGVVWKFSKGSGSSSGRESLALDRALPGFALNEVVAIQIKNQKEEVNLAREGDGEATWGVKERDGYPANYEFVKDLVTKAHDLRVIEELKFGQSQLGRLQLLSPASEGAKEAKPEEVGTLIIFKKANDQEMARLLLGKSPQQDASADNPFFNLGGTTGRFVQVGTVTDKAYKVKEAFTSLSVDVKGWLDKGFIAPTGGLKSIEVKIADPADQSWKVEREKEGADPVLADKKEGEEIDPEKVKQAGSAFSSAFFTDVATAADKEKTGLDAPKRTATVGFFDGFTYTIKVGNKVKPEDENSDYYLMVNVAYTPLPEPAAPATAEPPPEPQPTPVAEGETPDQKAEREKKDADAQAAWQQAKQSLDAAKAQHENDLKQWEASKKEKEERLAKEKKFEGRTFIVSKYTVDWFLKDRSYFKKAAAPAASAGPNPDGSSVSPVVTLPGAAPGAAAPTGSEPKRIEAVTPPIKVEIPQPKLPAPKEPIVKPAEKPTAPEPEIPPATFTPQADPPEEPSLATEPTEPEPVVPAPEAPVPVPTPAAPAEPAKE